MESVLVLEAWEPPPPWQWKASWCWKRGSLLHGNGKRPDAGSVGAFLVVVVVEVEVVEVEVVAFHEESIFEESFHTASILGSLPSSLRN